MTLIPRELEQISATTLQHYNANAEPFREATRDHDVAQNIAALLRHIEVEPPFTILDFGCGPGRDLKTFAALGHRAVGLDGAERFAVMARDETHCDVWLQDFLHLDLPDAHFEGLSEISCSRHMMLPRRKYASQTQDPTGRPAGDSRRAA